MSEDKKENHQYHYIKLNDFRTNFISGCIGGLTGQGLIDMNFFIDRPVIPQVTKHIFSEKGIGDEISRETKEGSIREIMCGIAMDINTAKIVNNWLLERIKELEKITNPSIKSK